MESGGAILLADVSDDKNRAAFSKLFEFFPSIDAENDKSKWGFLAKSMARICADFFHKGQIEPGNYSLENYHLSYAKEGKIPFDAGGGDGISLSKTKTFSFRLLPEHIKLLRHLNTRSWNGNVELIDAKRPYGDAINYYQDMADALGEPVPKNAKGEPDFPSKTIKRYTQLHREMLFALQAFWSYARNP